MYFGARARRRARYKRITRWAAYASLAAILLGVPGSLVAVRSIGSLTGTPPSSVTIAGGIETSESAASALRFKSRVFEARPTPEPSPKPEQTRPTPESSPKREQAEDEGGTEASGYDGPVTDIIYAAAAEFGLDGGYLLSVARCESGLDPGAVNPAGYHGLFQFDEQTWAAYGYGSIYDPVAQARTAAELLAAGQQSRWPNCA
jgi:Transglycosylase-like domain